jgi:hypothetical protein
MLPRCSGRVFSALLDGIVLCPYIVWRLPNAGIRSNRRDLPQPQSRPSHDTTARDRPKMPRPSRRYLVRPLCKKSTFTATRPFSTGGRRGRWDFVFALLNAGQEKFLATAEGARPSSALGLTYLSILLLLIVFTNVRLRGIHSVLALLTLAFIAVLLAWFGWWDDIAKLIPYLSVHMNSGFYLVFSTGLLIIWLMMFFVFDRLTYWRIRPGQMTEEHLIGGGAESFDTNGLRFQKLSSDFFRASLGLGAGDLKATTTGERGTTIEIPNVIFVGRKVHAIEKLISVKPERTS